MGWPASRLLREGGQAMNWIKSLWHIVRPRPLGYLVSEALKGALCAECKKPLRGSMIFYGHSTTHRTVHFECRTQEDDPVQEVQA